MQITRRGMFGLLGAAVLAYVAAPLRKAFAAVKKMAVPLSKAEKLKDVGGWAVLKIKDQDILFIRETADKVHAVSGVCTHKQCAVGYDPKSNKIVCPCHKSTFDVDGKVLTGPATVDLANYQATLSGDRIIIKVDQ